MVDQRWVSLNDLSTSADNQDLDRFQYGYDRNGNAQYKNNVVSSANSELYHANAAVSGDNSTAYDPLNRLTVSGRAKPASAGRIN